MKLQITIDGKTYAAEVEILEEDGSEGPPGSVPSGQAASPAPGAYTPGRQADERSADEKLYRSPVNGLAIKVNVAPGQMIQPCDVLLVLEAMKMETNVVAHHAGRVRSVRVAADGPVKLHEVLIEME